MKNPKSIVCIDTEKDQPQMTNEQTFFIDGYWLDKLPNHVNIDVFDKLFKFSHKKSTQVVEDTQSLSIFRLSFVLLINSTPFTILPHWSDPPICSKHSCVS